jgi:hypothetical protein
MIILCYWQFIFQALGNAALGMREKTIILPRTKRITDSRSNPQAIAINKC